MSQPRLSNSVARMGSSSAFRPLSSFRRQVRVQFTRRSKHLGRPATALQQQAAAAAAERPAVPVTFMLGGDEITVEAQPGQNLWEVEVWKYSSSSSGTVPSAGVVRACIAGVPPGFARLEVREVPEDDIWGVDGYDT